jgi:hypothetical protein
MFFTLVRVESWKVTVTLREGDKTEVTYFANEGLAMLAVEWAYAVHIEKLRDRKDRHRDVEEIQEYPLTDDGSWKVRSLYGKKVSWWLKSPRGYMAMKDYFTAEPEVFERCIIGDGEG